MLPTQENSNDPEICSSKYYEIEQGSQRSGKIWKSGNYQGIY